MDSTDRIAELLDNMLMHCDRKTDLLEREELIENAERLTARGLTENDAVVKTLADGGYIPF